MSVGVDGWPGSASPRCARCGHRHVPVPAAGQFTCGNCGVALVSREVGDSEGEGAPWERWLHRLIALGVCVALTGLGMRWHGGSRDARAASPALSGTASPSPLRSGVWGPPNRSEADMPKDGLRQKWEQLRRVPEGARDTAARNLELGDLSVLYAWRVAAESPDLPPAPAAGPGGPGMPGWEQRMRWRLAVGRYMSTSPASRAVLDEAAAAYATALDLAITREHKAMARTGLAEINCARGDYHRALSHLQQAEAVLGADDRRRRIRSRSLAGLGRTDEARRFFGRMAGPSPLPR